MQCLSSHGLNLSPTCSPLWCKVHLYSTESSRQIYFSLAEWHWAQPGSWPSPSVWWQGYHLRRWSPWAQSTPIPVSTFPGCLLGPPMQATNRKLNGNLAVLVGSPAKNIMSMVDCIHSHMLECITLSRGNDKNTDSLVVTSASSSVVFQKVS